MAASYNNEGGWRDNAGWKRLQGIALHQGDCFGLANQLLCVITCLGLIFSAVFGAVMWWQRRPKGRIGVPRTPSEGRRLGGVAVLVLGFAVAMPLVGASLLLFYLLDRWVLTRSPRLQVMLS